MEYKIHGTVMQALEVTLTRGKSVYTESGGMAWMTDGIDMKTSGRGSLGSMIGRKLAGESLFHDQLHLPGRASDNQPLHLKAPARSSRWLSSPATV